MSELEIVFEFEQRMLILTFFKSFIFSLHRPYFLSTFFYFLSTFFSTEFRGGIASSSWWSSFCCGACWSIGWRSCAVCGISSSSWPSSSSTVFPDSPSRECTARTRRPPIPRYNLNVAFAASFSNGGRLTHVHCGAPGPAHILQNGWPARAPPRPTWGYRITWRAYC